VFRGELSAERARITPERLAVIDADSGERLTYAALDERSRRAAALLLSHGLEAGDRFGILAYNCLELLELFLAAGKVGAIAVPLSTRATAHEIESIVRDCGMRVLFFGVEFAGIAESCRALVEETVPIEHAAAGFEPLTTFAELDDEAIYCLLYTSGTTGKPKGVMISRRMLYWNGYNTAVSWDLHDDDISPVFTPMYHAGGLAAFLIPIFTVGGAVVLHRTFDVTAVWRSIQQHRCTVILGVPTIYKLLMDAPEFATADLSHVRWLISGGAPLPQYIIAAYQQRGVAFKQGYGMTEVGVNCFTMTVDDSYRKAGSIGKPMPFTVVRLVDAEGREVAEDEVGEMEIRGPHVSSGYWGNPEATRLAYGEGGWFRTGDLARRDGDGFFYIAGRKKEMFISGGVNVYPAEIEGELVAHPAVADAAVLAVDDETWGEVGIAFVVRGGSIDEAGLTEYLAGRLAKYKLPRRYIFIEALPRTPYGKVVKEELRRMLREP
jgi:fatty-acyl-CoA synthase